MTDLKQLIYISNAIDRISNIDLVHILEASRRNNERLALTGMLLFVDGDFCQTLEGPSQALSEMLTTIRNDPRHRNLNLLYHEPIEARSFQDWTMGFDNISRADAADIDDVFKTSKNEINVRILNGLVSKVRVFMLGFYRSTSSSSRYKFNMPNT